MDNNDRLFFKVWRNVYLRFTILTYLKMYREEVDLMLYDSSTLIYGKKFEKVENLVYMCDYMIRDSKHLLKFKSLRRIKFTNNSLAEISGNALPSTIKEVIYPIGNYLITNDLSDLPSSVTSVKNVCFIKRFSTSRTSGQIQPYSKMIIIPKTLESIMFGKNSKFNITLGKFVSGDGICNGMICSFPSECLKTLDLGIGWNNNGVQLDQGIFSGNKLTTLNLGSYNHPLNVNVIPDSVTNLTLHHPVNELIGRNVIPYSVTQLHLKYKGLPNYSEMRLTPDSLPNSIKFLTLETSKFPIENGSIPNSVVYLCLCDNFDIKFSKGMLSSTVSSLKTLIIPDSQSLDIEEGSLVNSITRLVFKQKARSFANINEIGWNQPIDIGFFPNRLISLLLGDGFNQFLKPGILPPTLLELRLGRSYNYILVVGSLPSRLQKLIFSEDSNFNQPIDEIGILPSLLVHLEFNNKFSQPIKTIGILPSTLTTLILPREFDPLIPKEVIPKIDDIRYLNFF